jgi:hypothetical protein
MSGSWLQRSGQAWKPRVAVWAAIGSFACLLIPLGLSQIVGKRSHWLPLLMLLGLPMGIVNLVLPMLVRCRVCGLQLETSSLARSLSRDHRLAWVESLEVCPVCGDDGSASIESRSRWRNSGSNAETPYWSRARILFGVFAAVLLVGGGVWLGGRYRVR